MTVVFIVVLVSTMAITQSCFSTEQSFTPPTDSPAVINYTDIIHTDTQTPHLLQKGKNGLSTRAEEDTEEPMQDQTILKGHKLKLATEQVISRKRELFEVNKIK